jgi:hypothetical protein
VLVFPIGAAGKKHSKNIEDIGFGKLHAISPKRLYTACFWT